MRVRGSMGAKLFRLWSFLLACSWGWLHGCGGLPEKGEMVLAPSPARDGQGGTPGPQGVAVVSSMVQARISEAFQVDLYLPAIQGGGLDRSKAPYPTVVFLHGGAVAPQRYAWLYTHLASRGYVVIVPHHVLSLAFFESENASIALRAMLKRAEQEGSPIFGIIKRGGPTAIIGHSLGGVVASWQWRKEQQYTTLVQLASYPSGRYEARNNSSYLSLTGATDKRVTVESAKEGYGQIPGAKMFAVVGGMNHYDWVADATPSELASDGPPAQDLAKTRQQAMHLLDTWLDATLRGDQDAKKALLNNTFENINIERALP